MLRYGIIGCVMMCLTSGSAFAMAQEGCGGECITCHSLSEKEAATLLSGLGTVKSVKPSAVRGLYEIQLEKNGTQATAYMDYGKKNIVAGQIFDLATRKPVTPKPTELVKADPVELASIANDNSLVMGNSKGTKKLFVFTDPDCPFCGKLHAELKKLADMDKSLAIYIKMFPLKIHPKAYEKARVILSRKSLKLLENSFSGGVLPLPGPSDTSKAVDDSIKFAESIGINSTPTLVFPDGRIVPGFKDASAIARLLTGEK